MLIFKEINPQGEIKWGEKANYYFGVWKTDVHVITDSRFMKTASLPQSKGATELPDLKSEPIQTEPLVEPGSSGSSTEGGATRERLGENVVQKHESPPCSAKLSTCPFPHRPAGDRRLIP